MSSHDKIPKQRELIDYIRREEYSLDSNASAQEQRRSKNMREILGRALKLLAEDLYSEQTHFVLELIQNADDNTYPEGVLPRLSFNLSPKRLLLANNEVGFSEAHVSALCNLGKSSKENKKGYIGEKGIGFKSVFTVSNAPEIHSNGYHFRFNRTDPSNLLGYVVPEWCNPSEEITLDGTTIVLPAKLGKEFSSETFKDLDAGLLLFLVKLRELELRENGNTTIFKRHDEEKFSCLKSIFIEPNGKTQSEESRFLRTTLSVSMLGASDEKRLDIKISDVMLAFPVDSNGKASPQETSQVFAFLPVRRFGFKFSIQADFILSSSREDIHKERKWNRRLRDSLAKAFVNAVDDFKMTETLSFSYLKFIPNDSEVIDLFFKPVITQIVQLLSKSKCLPSAVGEWRIPIDLRFGGKQFQDLFPSSVAQELFGFDYVDSRMEVDEKLLRKLGAKAITDHDVVSVFELHGDWLRKQPKEWMARWYAYLSELDGPALIKAGLMSTACVPTSAGSFVVPDQISTFYPLSRGRKFGFEHELTIIDGELLTEAMRHSKKIGEFFSALNVKKDDAFDLVSSHILPRHSGDVWMTSGNKALLGHVRYIKEKFEHYLSGAVIAGKSREDAIKNIGDGIKLGTKKATDGEWFFDRAKNVYLSKEYQPAFCIESLLGKDLSKGLLVSAEYLSAKTKDIKGEAESWRDFFTCIGVCVAPKIEELPNGDFHCSAELRALLESSKSSLRKAVLECLDQNWNCYSKCLIFLERVGRYRYPSESGFGTALYSMTAPTKKRMNIPICDAYYPSEEIKHLFGDTPVYLDANLTQAELLQACHVTFRVDVNACVKRLKQLKGDGGDTTPQLHAIYRHLERLWDKEGALIKQAFDHEGLIRVKGPHAIWALPGEVAWHSSSSFLDSLYPPLQGQYRDFSAFFNNKLGIPRELPIAEMVAALLRLGEIGSVEERLREAIAIYKRASRDLTSRTGKEALAPDWLDTFLFEDVFLNQHGALVANDESLFANDSPELGALFVSDPEISLFVVPFEDLARVRSLMEAAKVRSLAASVEVNVIEAEGGQVMDDLTAKVRTVLVYIGRAFYGKSHVMFEAALEQGLFKRLRDIEIVEVPNLQIEVTVANVSKMATSDIATTGNKILIKRGARSVKDQLAIEICKFLRAPDELADTVCRLLLTENAEAAEDFLRVRRISSLPPDMEKALWGDESELSAGSASDAERNSDAQAPEEFEESSAGGGEDDIRGDVGTSSAVKPQTGPGAPGNQEAAVTGLARGSPASEEQKSSKQGSPSTSAQGGVHGDLNRVRPSAKAHASALQAQDVLALDQDAHSSGTRVETALRPGLCVDDSEGPGGPKPRADPRLVLRFEGPKSGRSSKRARKQGQAFRAKSGRLMSYAASPGDAERASKEEDPSRAAARDAIAQAAVDYFMLTQGTRWKSLLSMPHNNPGFDIKAVSHEDQDEFIEVKGQGGAWTEDGVALTPTELAEAQRRGEHYWLCVVEYATDAKRRTLYLLKNPYGLTQQFRFDSGWKSAARIEAAVPLKPEAGLYVDLPKIGKGRIQSVRKKGKFYNLHVILESGSQVYKLFNPATMTLSTE